MSKYYRPQRVRNLYQPGLEFTLSRSKIDLFLECPRCFYNDRRLGVGRPPGFPFTLNSAVDTLLKREFDLYRLARQPHPYMTNAGIDAIPFSHERLEEWRDALRRGVRAKHSLTNLTISGGIDDLWVTPEGELIIVDYKATSKKDQVNLDADWQISYKRQMEVYSWLFKQNGFKVHRTGYFVYCNGNSESEKFDGRLNFSVSVLGYDINDAWVDSTVVRAFDCLNQVLPPDHDPGCDFCVYHRTLLEHAKKFETAQHQF